MKPDVVLLLDTYFNVAVWNGEHIQKWKEAGYHEQPEYQNLKELLEAPYEDVKVTITIHPRT